MTSRSEADAAAVHRAIAEERERTELRIVSLQRDFDEIVAASESVATDDEHDPEGATIAFERQQIAALISLSQQRLEQLDEALDGVRAGTYGVCEHCGDQIPLERLLARPTATHCVRCAAL